MTVVRVAIAAGRPGDLRALAERAGLRVVAEDADQQVALDLARDRGAEVIIIDGAPSILFDETLPAVAVGDDLADLAPSGVYGAMPSAPGPRALVEAVELAAARASELAAARAEADRLRDQLETRKLVERAKGILMDRLKISEADAYRRLQRASQDENRKMRDIADGIVRTERILATDAASWPGSDAAPGTEPAHPRATRSAG